MIFQNGVNEEKLMDYLSTNNYENYNYKKIICNSSLFNESIDATYIINVENNGRLSIILKKIIQYPTTDTIYFVINKGYVKGKKDEWIKSSVDDIIDCNYNIFNHANSNDYNNILILEDDCIFDKNIISEKNNINNFIKSKNNTEFQYYLGCIPMFMFPYDYNNFYNITSSGTQAVIYSNEMRKKILKIKPYTITDWDYFNNFSNFNRYIYYKPLCYQLFPETENFSNWGINHNPIYYFISTFVSKNVIKFFNLDTQIEPGYTFFYIYAKLFFFIIIVLIIIFYLALSKIKLN